MHLTPSFLQFCNITPYKKNFSNLLLKCLGFIYWIINSIRRLNRIFLLSYRDYEFHLKEIIPHYVKTNRRILTTQDLTSIYMKAIHNSRLSSPSSQEFMHLAIMRSFIQATTTYRKTTHNSQFQYIPNTSIYLSRFKSLNFHN